VYAIHNFTSVDVMVSDEWRFHIYCLVIQCARSFLFLSNFCVPINSEWLRVNTFCLSGQKSFFALFVYSSHNFKHIYVCLKWQDIFNPYRSNVELKWTAPFVVPGQMSSSGRHSIILQCFVFVFPKLLSFGGCFWNVWIRDFLEN
jgi:hypothetical protein